MNEMTRQHLEAYLDGVMSEADRRRFERLLHQDSELRRAVDDQRRINVSLQRMFPVQSAGGARSVLARLEPSQPRWNGRESSRALPRSQQTDPRSWRRWVAVAAVFAILAFTVWANRSYYFPQPTHRIVGQSRPIEHFYRAKVDSGYKPEIAFTNNNDLKALVHDQFGQSLTMADFPAARFAVSGIDRCDMLSDKTLAVMMKIDGREVIVLIDQVTTSPHAPLSASCLLHAFETQIGQLKLVEVTPWPEPRALALFGSSDSRKP